MSKRLLASRPAFFEHGLIVLDRNSTDEFRAMVGMVYSRAFMRPFNERKGFGESPFPGPFMPFAKGTEAFFEHPDVEAHCVFVDAADLGSDWAREWEHRAVREASGVTGGG